MSNLSQIRTGLEALTSAIDELSNRPTPQPEILDRALSGNKINGGKITNFSSVGISDEARQTVLTVNDDGISVNAMNVNRIKNALTVDGELKVNGEIFATRLSVKEVSADIRNERTSPLEFRAERNSLSGKGIIWTGLDYTKQFVYQDNPARIWSSEDIDLNRDKIYRIDKLPVLTLTTLGSSVTESNLQSVGTLQGLSVEGNLTIDNYVYWDSASERLGVGTQEPNGKLSIVDLEHEFIVDYDLDRKFKLGTYTNSGLDLVTDNTVRLSVSSNGAVGIASTLNVAQSIGVGVSNVATDVDITTQGPVRLQGKKFETLSTKPGTGNYVKGDIVWNNNPQPTGYVGWICIRSGTPGDWKGFGLIEN